MKFTSALLLVAAAAAVLTNAGSGVDAIEVLSRCNFKDGREGSCRMPTDCNDTEGGGMQEAGHCGNGKEKCCSYMYNPVNDCQKMVSPEWESTAMNQQDMNAEAYQRAICSDKLLAYAIGEYAIVADNSKFYLEQHEAAQKFREFRDAQAATDANEIAHNGSMWDMIDSGVKFRLTEQYRKHIWSKVMDHVKNK